MNVTVTGGTGFIGRRLVDRLIAGGHSVHVVGRTPRTGLAPGLRLSLWDATEGPPPEESLSEADAVVHLAGEPVSQRWTPETKRRIRASRIDGTENLVKGLAQLAKPPAVLVSTSGIDYYGDRGDEALTESSSPGSGFLPEVCIGWEKAADGAEPLGIRVVKLRFGLVLGMGGAMALMLTPFKLGLGGRLGDGSQWTAWIHVDDVVSLICYALETESMRGPFNATAPNPVRNAQFTQTLARVLRRPSFFPVPVFGLKLMFGEMSEIMLASHRVLPRETENAGFKFTFPDLGPALKNLLA
ncbi:MAG: TIGR01777 family oxidoreductase [Bryobacteraceae bacterium]|nr:TIGR01777 family oxidoreductase [Bryobacteraceae bacterium]